MRVCVPITRDEGLESPVSAHFGSAPAFAIVDCDTGDVAVLQNRNQHHAHGACQPLAALAGQGVDAVVVGGIGQGALARLQAAGVEVVQAELATVREALEGYRSGTLKAMSPRAVCAHHGEANTDGCGPHRHGR
jgi:predicted Fe-Mo cluster-binding NifX family protein